MSKLGGLKLVRASLSSWRRPVALHAVVERGGGRRLQDARHRPRDVGELDELALALEDGGVVGVEADDEAGEHPEAGVLDDADLLQRVAARRFWNFAIRFSASEAGVSMPMKTYMKLAATIALSSSGLVGQVDRGFGVERKG